MHSSICRVRAASSFLGGSSLPQMGHSSSSAIWRRGRGGCWLGRAGRGACVNAERGNMLTTDCEPGPMLNGICPLLGVV
jgi:hypothetical protein